MSRVRLQKLIASAGLTSRRKAEEWITEGRVRVNGRVVTVLGTTVDPVTDEVRVGRRVVRPLARRTILLHKPPGVLTTLSDPRGRRTVVDLLPRSLSSAHLKPVGRLDKDTEGLLILTNDGELAQRIAHPRSGCDKEYQARVRGHVSPATLRTLCRGVMLDGRRTSPCEAKVVRKGKDFTDVSLVLHEGRHHQVRKMLLVVGHPVRLLRRVRIGPLRLAGIPRGGWRDLRPVDAKRLRDRLAVSG